MSELIKVKSGKHELAMLDPDKSIEREVFSEHGYEPACVALLEEILLKNRNKKRFFDIGAHYGFYSKLVSMIDPSIEIFAFEPGHDALEIFKVNLQGHSSVRIFDKALSDAEGSRNFKGRTFVEEKKSANSIQLETISLDALELDLDGTLNIAKVDVHGAEAEVILGMGEDLAKFDYLFIELHAEHLITKYSYEVIFDRLQELGFLIFELPGFRDRLEPVLHHLSKDFWPSITDYSQWSEIDIARERMVFATKS